MQDSYGALGPAEIDKLRRFPCIFAYEAFNKLDPRFGLIRDVTVRQDEVRVDYELHELDTFLTAKQLEDMMFELEISKWELNRTRWAVKDVDLPAELNRKCIALPRCSTCRAKDQPQGPSVRRRTLFPWRGASLC
ncbi:hypothetical protein FHS85_000798 [Rhodoligotrophos appendicifer]|uniref:hypothetical protein n=1 Tax=Rhodoligotrophos appendicifer TaxID=987056 RepID=UPI0024823DAF|nr:hypothetical protein [Rhodoligotrophos appendicifer]